MNYPVVISNPTKAQTSRTNVLYKYNCLHGKIFLFGNLIILYSVKTKSKELVLNNGSKNDTTVETFLYSTIL